jgi:hypothetical protein
MVITQYTCPFFVSVIITDDGQNKQTKHFVEDKYVWAVCVCVQCLNCCVCSNNGNRCRIFCWNIVQRILENSMSCSLCKKNDHTSLESYIKVQQLHNEPLQTTGNWMFHYYVIFTAVRGKNLVNHTNGPFDLSPLFKQCLNLLDNIICTQNLTLSSPAMPCGIMLFICP